MIIHWIKDKKKQYPTTVAEIISLLQLGEITEESLAWHKGCASWMPLKELPALQDFFAKSSSVASLSEATPTIIEVPIAPEAQPKLEAAPEPESPTPQESSNTASTSSLPDDLQDKLLANKLVMLKMPSAVQRFLARMFDLALYGFLYMLLLNLREIPYSLSLELGNPFVWLPFIPLEAAVISHFRTTPGKVLLGMKLYSVKGPEGLSFGNCLRRSFLVFALGVGMMLTSFPLPLFLIALALSYRKLQKQGYTSWDERCQTVILQTKKPSKIQPFIIGVLIIYTMMSTVQLMAPWMPELIELRSEMSPEFAQFVDEYRQILPPDVQETLFPNKPKTPAE